jgi:Raf kinase inhibitor-like YbhB/YbcL family protein
MSEQGFTLTSPVLVSDGLFPASHTCEGDNTPPPLEWLHPPEETQSFALILDDPDAPSGTFTHWVLFDIPGTAQQLPHNGETPGISGRNDFQQDGYGGPCPPPNHGQHRYYFHLFALDVESLGLSLGVRRREVEYAMQGHVLDQTTLMGRFERRTG